MFARSAEPPVTDMVCVPGGTFLMGSEQFYPEEGPVRPVTVDGFWIDRYPVTNAQFRDFVEATGYVTVAERVPSPESYPGVDPEQLVPGALVFRQPPRGTSARDYRAWWQYTPRAAWRSPEGPGSTIEHLARHPVVHVAYEDAQAYAAWAGKSLPTEAEWELAARGGLNGATYAWGNEPAPDGRFLANTWQGEFPWENLMLDGFKGSSPVGAFPANGFGLFDMAGNVWEWTSDIYTSPRIDRGKKSCCGRSSRGHGSGADGIPVKVLKGGSFLCAPNYCLRYRPAARQGLAIDTSACHIGFRCVVRPDQSAPRHSLGTP